MPFKAHPPKPVLLSCYWLVGISDLNRRLLVGVVVWAEGGCRGRPPELQVICESHSAATPESHSELKQRGQVGAQRAPSSWA